MKTIKNDLLNSWIFYRQERERILANPYQRKNTKERILQNIQNKINEYFTTINILSKNKI